MNICNLPECREQQKTEPFLSNKTNTTINYSSKAQQYTYSYVLQKNVEIEKCECTLRNRKIRAIIRLHILYRKKNEIIKPSIKIKKKRINTLNTKVLKWK